ncbi:uncharacterized protein L969DRAFT_87044 [Mixia osmundae IAM 14324]|uniref:uncharacterized protein n=1 Tax=Mixia osmundae (strain CBS 9802 / IAM 14324 / JCM 22182 / KY 12970) TaxID=764103 RepID=UPI0004A550CB|nr:uncharacterized protein L969DRAFT_87044 [Mixia osmundae IAM 14324]KEI40395.1 hypothetical protein L969DRAFT_87044 [Mixia osmundae IAM 14324]
MMLHCTTAMHITSAASVVVSSRSLIGQDETYITKKGWRETSAWYRTLVSLACIRLRDERLVSHTRPSSALSIFLSSVLRLPSVAVEPRAGSDERVSLQGRPHAAEHLSQADTLRSLQIPRLELSVADRLQSYLRAPVFIGKARSRGGCCLLADQLLV